MDALGTRPGLGMDALGAYPMDRDAAMQGLLAWASGVGQASGLRPLGSGSSALAAGAVPALATYQRAQQMAEQRQAQAAQTQLLKSRLAEEQAKRVGMARVGQMLDAGALSATDPNLTRALASEMIKIPGLEGTAIGLLTRKPETYTVGQGQKVVDASGRVIAQGDPKVPEGYQLGPGGMAPVPGGPADPVTARRLAQARHVVEPDRELVPAQGADGVMRYVPRSQAAGMMVPDKETAKSREIDALVRQGLSRDDAEGIAYGILQLRTDPVSGNMFVIDQRTMRRRPVETEGGQTRPDLPKETQRKLDDDLARIDKVLPVIDKLSKTLTNADVGIGGVAVEGYSRLAGQIPGVGDAALDNPTVQQNIDQRAELRRIRNALVDSGRMSNQEGQRILAEFPSDGAFESAPRARQVLGKISTFLRSDRDAINRRLGRSDKPAEGPVKVTTEGEWKALKPGTEYLDGSGKLKVKK